MPPRYALYKVDDAGEDVTVDGEKFDSLLDKMLSADPLTYKNLQNEPKLRKDGKRKRSGRKKQKAR